MKLNIAYPVTGCQKLLDIDDDRKLRPFMEKRIAQEVDASCLGNEWKGYTLRITGGNDKQGFPMMQGVLTNQRVRLLLDKRHKCYRQRRKGERKRKSVRGCIVDGNLSVIACIITKRGEQDIDGLTNKTIPRRLGPKRANHIRKLFNLSKEDDVRKYAVKRSLTKESKKPRYKAPKIQRLITPRRIQRKRHMLSLKKRRAEKQRILQNEYAKLLQQFAKEKRERKRSESKRRSSSRLSESKA